MRIGITGTDRMYEKLAPKLASCGAEVVRAARSAVVPCNAEGLAEAVRHLSEYRWIVFTSRNALDLFFDAVKREHVAKSVFDRIRFAVVGTGTGTYLETFGFHASCMPEEFTTEALAKKLCGAVKPGERLLMPRAKQGSKILTARLDEAKLEYTDLPIYDIEAESGSMELFRQLDYITFESGSGVRGFFADPGDAEERCQLLMTAVMPVCIGPVTADVLAQYGVTRSLIAKDYTADGICEIIFGEN